MTIACTKSVLLRKLFYDKSKVLQKLYFLENFLKILGGIGQIIRHSHYNLHLLMIILPDFYKGQACEYFHI